MNIFYENKFCLCVRQNYLVRNTKIFIKMHNSVRCKIMYSSLNLTMIIDLITLTLTLLYRQYKFNTGVGVFRTGGLLGPRLEGLY